MGLESLMFCSIFFEPSEEIPLYGNVPSLSEPIGNVSESNPLIIRPLPLLGADLHIHQESGLGGIKPYGENHSYPLNSYETAMADLYADLLKIGVIKKIK